MKITAVDILIAQVRSDSKLRAYCNLIIDFDFAAKEFRVVEPEPGKLILSMPSRKRTASCPACRTYNPLRARYCNSCGDELVFTEPRDGPGGSPYHEDLFHPIHSTARRWMEDAILGVYRAESRFVAGQAQGFKPDWARYDPEKLVRGVREFGK